MVGRMLRISDRLGAQERAELTMKQMVVAAFGNDCAAIDAAYTTGVRLVQGDVSKGRMLRYDRALSLLRWARMRMPHSDRIARPSENR
jgi:hypothetical protein